MVFELISVKTIAQCVWAPIEQNRGKGTINFLSLQDHFQSYLHKHPYRNLTNIKYSKVSFQDL